MRTTEMLKFFIKPSRSTLAVVFLLVFHAASAKSAPPKMVKVSPPPPLPVPALNLTLPDTDLKQTTTDGLLSLQRPLLSPAPADNLQLLAEHHKKPPVDMGCEMGLAQTLAPEVSLSSRLGGVCDLKYHY